MLKNSHLFTRSWGRIKISAFVIALGSDFQIILGGGDTHLGAVALCGNCEESALFSRKGHYELELAYDMAQNLTKELGGFVAVSAGIHYPSITKEEIKEVIRLCALLKEDITNYFKNKE